MQAYKLKGKIDNDGKLIINEATNLKPGAVEVIILQTTTKIDNNSPEQEKSANNRPSKVKTFQEWFAKTAPTTSALTVEDTKWNYLKEKHNL